MDVLCILLTRSALTSAVGLCRCVNAFAHASSLNQRRASTKTVSKEPAPFLALVSVWGTRMGEDILSFSKEEINAISKYNK